MKAISGHSVVAGDTGTWTAVEPRDGEQELKPGQAQDCCQP
ncbi:MAG: hypothetical protein ACLVJN_10070 [Streptococcus parasanguinis]